MHFVQRGKGKTMSEYIVEAESRADLVDGHWYGGEELVRCGECKWYEEENHNCLDEMGFARIWEPTDYCSFGERKDDE